ncbi:MAG: hypothetical protein KKC76_06210 [Proteobacteria bacterium]|nr:hypothetical protein [Pseudomonadota bacterium]MBU4297614.1 hypothetical protein [Pseudomonadota bacterium]MCG2750023.1 hypothetical protein [Desulfobulbaceae bacterium]
MFYKNSRYRKQPFTVTIDAKARRFKSVTLRATPETDGAFQHTIEQGDRLDHLAYKYYKAPRKWWRIVDGNTEFFSPLDLLGAGVTKCVRISLGHDDEAGEPPWSVLAGKLSALVGVASYQFEEKVLLDEDTVTVAGEEIPVADQSYLRAVIIDYNSLTITIDALTAAINAAGFIAGTPENRGRIGRKIIIPPDAPA